MMKKCASYTIDTVRMLCTVVEKSFNNNLDQCEKTIEFISRWLLLPDENDDHAFDITLNKPIWSLAHIYTFFEFDQNGLLSFYTACRIIDQLDSTQSFYNDLYQNGQQTRSTVRENLFRSMFNYLWKNLCDLCSTDHSTDQWIHSYTFISKYYPSEKVLEQIQLVRVKGQIEFMNLAYLIFLNENTVQPKELVLQLLQATSLLNDDIDGRHINPGTSVCLKSLPKIINTIHEYRNADNSTLMIDIQQWIISLLKSTNQSCEEEIKYLLKFLNQPTRQLALSMKQFLFDELMNILFKLKQQNRPGANKQNVDFWDRMILLPIIVDCIGEADLQNYRIPYHSSVVTDTYQKQTLVDLFFFHLRRIANDDLVNFQLVHKILMYNLPPNNNQRLLSNIGIIFKQLKDYFCIQLTALASCEKDLNNQNEQSINNVLNNIIREYLTIDPQSIQLTPNIQLFISTIIAKRSWNYFLDLLKSQRFQRLNGQWSDQLYNLLEIRHTTPRTKYLQLCHQLHFTLSMNNTDSIFPNLHQPYNELSKLIDQSVKTNDQQRWKPLTDWIQLKLTSNPPLLNPTEIKVMLLLNIYYDYYCNNQLILLDTLLPVIENTLQPSPEELCVFRAFLNPEQHMIGYSAMNNNADINYLNNLFKLDCIDEDELPIRHSMVNLLAMILLGGKQNFLWTFTFEPLKLQSTFGFGSTRHEIILAHGTHYDCGCVFSENGDLIHFPNNRGNGGALSVPAVYVAYFSTFGAMAWHLLLFNTSTDNLYGPILAKHAVDNNEAGGRMAGNTVRTKVCHFVRARLFSTHNLLSIQMNQDDTCMLLNRCFEQMAKLTQPETVWIKPVYTKFEEKFQAEQEYQSHIFYPIHQQLSEYKKLINGLYLQSQIQKNLQDYVSQMSILIQFKHFKTELGNPKNEQLSLNILRYIFNSFDFLKMTSYIYDLTRFYLLIHQTYSHLIEYDEFSRITLKELYDRGQKREKKSNRFNYQNQTNEHWTIIENGIKAVNAYHKFADGLIQPGACDETQHFQTISIETPISYLLTTENHDEGDIVMRILSVLVDFHNKSLDLLEKEMNNNPESLLRDLVDKLSGRELSIVQIVRENTGVITLNDQDCHSIECLSRASLEIEEEYFPKSNVQFNFNFLYIQFYIIRSYLLMCRMNYRHVHHKYQCYIQQEPIIYRPEKKSIYSLNDPQFSYLQEMTLGKLYDEYNLLRQLIDLLKHQRDDVSNINLYEFLRTNDGNNEIVRQFENCQIKDFQLCYIDDVCQLYEELINGFHYSILNVSHLLRIPMDHQQNAALDKTLIQSLDNLKTEEFEPIIRTITEFLNELKDIEETLQQQSSLPLAEVYKWVTVENSIVAMIPEEIKCENYVPLIIKLIEIRSKLQEQTINKEEQNKEKWNDNFDEQPKEQENMPGIFEKFVEPHLIEIDPEEIVIIRPSSPFKENPEEDENGASDIVHDRSRTSSFDINTLTNMPFKENPEENENGASDIVHNRSRTSSFDINTLTNMPFEENSEENENGGSGNVHDRSRTSSFDINISTNTPLEENRDPTIIPKEGENNGSNNVHDRSRTSSVTSSSTDTEGPGSVPPPSEPTLIHSYRPLFELNMEPIPLNASSLFGKIRDPKQPADVALSSISNSLRIETVYPDGTRKATRIKPENIYPKLKTTFKEKNYSFEEFVIVDENQIFVDFTNENNDSTSTRISSEYHILPKTSLVSLILQLESEEIEYLVTSKCEISSIINHFLIDRRFTFTSSNTFLGFFDELGSYIQEDKTIESVYRSQNTIRIKVIKYEDNTSELSKVVLTFNEVMKENLFHPMTKWEQIDLWLKTTDTFSSHYSFCHREQKIILNEDQSLPSTPATIDGVSNEEIMTVILSYETNQQLIRILKSCPVADLLREEPYLRQLNVRIPSSDCILVRKNEDDDEEILTAADLEESIGNYSSDAIRFQIAILVQIVQYDNNRLISQPISSRNITIEQLIQSIPNRDDIYQYLASSNSHRILSDTEQLVNLTETKFYLLKENEICSIIIETDDEKVIQQRYAAFTTIDDLYKQNEDIIVDQYLLFDDAIILSRKTPLTCFQQIKSPIRFKLTSERYSANVTILNDEEKDSSLQFRCSPSIDMPSLSKLTCQLFNVNRRFYQLVEMDGTEFDDSLSLYELTDSLNDVQLKLISIADAKCLVMYEERSITIPANKTTLASMVFEEAFGKFFIPEEQMDMYELQILNDQDDFEEIDTSFSIGDILKDFSIESMTISFKLVKK